MKNRKFLWMPLAKNLAIPPTDNAIRIVSAEDSTSSVTQLPERKTTVMAAPVSNGSAVNSSPGNGAVSRNRMKNQNSESKSAGTASVTDSDYHTSHGDGAFTIHLDAADQNDADHTDDANGRDLVG